MICFGVRIQDGFITRIYSQSFTKMHLKRLKKVSRTIFGNCEMKTRNGNESIKLQFVFESLSPLVADKSTASAVLFVWRNT